MYILALASGLQQDATGGRGELRPYKGLANQLRRAAFGPWAAVSIF
jgi:hypothetical protein